MQNDSNSNAIHWFRKGLRLHDNPALVAACDAIIKHKKKAGGQQRNPPLIFPLFIIDPHFANDATVGVNRYRFLLESLHDLDASLRKCGSRLFVARGKPDEVLPRLVKEWKVSCVTWEHDTSPFATTRDEKLKKTLTDDIDGCEVLVKTSHTLWDPAALMKLHGQDLPPTVYQSFLKLTSRAGTPAAPISKTIVDASKVVQDALRGSTYPDALIKDDHIKPSSKNRNSKQALSFSFAVPTLEEMGYTAPLSEGKYAGGESEALRRLKETVTDQEAWVQKFEKPNTSPNSLEPSTTVLSPYLKFGCLSPRLLWQELIRIEKKAKTTPSQPPVSLRGQLLWREFYYLVGAFTPNYGRMRGNPICKQIPWSNDDALFTAWRDAKTGFPFIDAIMTQLREEGWIHHLARHAVACFLTRGDLWQSWEKGAQVFDRWLLDADWSLNVGNWMWLSASCFFYQYFRIYSPIAFGKKTDPKGLYIKKYLPVLAKFPEKYIFEPWTAPLTVQHACGCVIGKDYPKPIIKDHTKTSKENMAKMAAAYEANKNGVGAAAPVDMSNTEEASSPKRRAPASKRCRSASPISVRSTSSSSSSDCVVVRTSEPSTKRHRKEQSKTKRK